MTEEKVCLTATQIENIGKAYAKEIEGKEVPNTCAKASKWVKGYFGKKKPKKEQTVEGWINTKISSKINQKINGFLEQLF